MIVSWHIIVRLCEISAFHPAFKWRGNHHTLLQLRRSSILYAESPGRSFPLAGCPVWLLERRRGAWFTQDRRPYQRTESLFLQRQTCGRRIARFDRQTRLLHASGPLSRRVER